MCIWLIASQIHGTCATERTRMVDTARFINVVKNDADALAWPALVHCTPSAMNAHGAHIKTFVKMSLAVNITLLDVLNDITSSRI